MIVTDSYNLELNARHSRARALPRLPWQRLEDPVTVKAEIKGETNICMCLFVYIYIYLLNKCYIFTT